MKRNKGYYWVYKDYWRIAHWNGDSWHMVGNQFQYNDIYFTEINEHRIEDRTKPFIPNLYEHTNWTF